MAGMNFEPPISIEVLIKMYQDAYKKLHKKHISKPAILCVFLLWLVDEITKRVSEMEETAIEVEKLKE